MAVRKRAPGGGRKPAGEFSGLDETLSVRMPADMKAMLKASAKGRAEGKGWKLTQELLYRLNMSFYREQDEQRDRAATSLCYLLGQVISTVAFNVQPRDWRSDPFSFQTVRLAFNHLLDALEPPGEVVAPRQGPDNMFAAIDLVWAVPGDRLFTAQRYPTPEAMARFTADVLLMRLAEKSGEIPGRSVPRAERDLEFGMADARRHLVIKKEE